MSSFLTSTDIKNLTGVYSRHFETFSAHSNVTVYKEPLKTLSLPSGVTWAGFTEDANPDNYSYSNVTGIYPCVVIDKNKLQNNKTLEDVGLKIGQEQIVIKVERNCKDFIDQKPTMKLELNDGRVYNNYSLYTTQNYFGLMYYYYLLDRTT